MKKSHKKIILMIAILLVLLVIIVCAILKNKDTTKLVSVKSQKELQRIYEGEEFELNSTFINILTMPFSFSMPRYYLNDDLLVTEGLSTTTKSSSGLTPSTLTGGSTSIDSVSNSYQTKDYSTTNIQVENVDEADITKTDGDYIYSISEDNVIITDVREPEEIKILKKIAISEGTPEDLMLYKDTLTVISSTTGNSTNKNTIVSIYNIQDKAKPILEKSYTLYEPYYTSRCIDNKLYVISSGRLRKENNEIVTYYLEDRQKKDINLKDIQYLKDLPTDEQTIISMVNLDNTQEKVKVKSYLMNIENAYVSEKNIYLLNESYPSSYDVSILDIFGWKGILGLGDYEENDYSGKCTDIYKFNILEDGTVEYETKAKVEGTTINQFSVDEYDNHLRVALQNNNGSRIVVFDEKLNQLGQTPYLAKGEKMYSSRFLGNKAYLVTYQTIDPLYVIDLSNPTNPTVLGELKIPGYSTYLHPYDENHIIGIGMQTEETIRKNSSGKVLSKTARITGMKMALFDVSDVNNPIQISETVIGDSRATSAILTNHKALLFSKEKELIAIPVNNYSEDFAITNSSENYEDMVSSYTNYSKNYVSEGYFVYKLNLTDGFSLKGVINHETTSQKSSYYSTATKLLRGLYIDNNLYTISENMLKVNNLDDLELISELKIKGGN